MRARLRGLWQHADFLRLWTGQTISVFGSMVGGTALSFTAILFLNATPIQMSILQSLELAPALLIGLFAGAWVDRFRRRPLLIWADLGRALALALIPLAFLAGGLKIGLLYGVALLVSLLTVVFNLAYQTYLPSLVGREAVLEGNSKLSASAAVAEFGGFSLGGWLVQILTAPLAMLIDAISFLVSAFSIYKIRTPEDAQPLEQQAPMIKEIQGGIRAVFSHPLLRPSGLVIFLERFFGGMFGAVVVLYMSRELGFNPGVLGMIWSIGGISSFFGAALAPRVTQRYGAGRVMAIGLALFGVAAMLIPLAQGTTLLSAALLMLQQTGDGFFVAYEINLTSLRQSVTAEHLLGRVNSVMYILGIGATLAGTLLGGGLGSLAGIRLTLFLASAGMILSALVLFLSPLWGFREPSPVAADS